MPASKFFNLRIAAYGSCAMGLLWIWHLHCVRASSSHDEALTSLTRALQNRDESSILALSTEQGFKVLWDSARRSGGGRHLGERFSNEREFVDRNGWRFWDSTHAAAEWRWRYIDVVTAHGFYMVKTWTGWKLDNYR